MTFTTSMYIHDFTGLSVCDGRYKCLEELGRGAYGVVYRAIGYNAWNAGDPAPTEYAIKIICKDDTGTPNNPADSSFCEPTFQNRQDIEILNHDALSGHSNVVTLRECVDDFQYRYMILDYCAGPDLYSTLTLRPFWRDNARVKTVFLQILDAVDACHSQGVFHRDIKPENILSSGDGTTIFLTDFGLSTNNFAKYHTGCGTLPYMSPECIGQEKFDGLGPYHPRQADIWALGILLFEIITGTRPWLAATTSDPQFALFMKNGYYLQEMYPISSEVENLLDRMLQIKSTRRITMQNIKEYVQSIDSFFLGDDDDDESLWTSSNQQAAKLCSRNLKNSDPPLVLPETKVLKQPTEALKEVDITCVNVRMVYHGGSSEFNTLFPSFSEVSPGYRFCLKQERVHKKNDPLPGVFVIGSVSSDWGGPTTPQRITTHPGVRIDSIDLAEVELKKVIHEGFWNPSQSISDEPAPWDPPATGKKKLYARDFKRLAGYRKVRDFN